MRYLLMVAAATTLATSAGAQAAADLDPSVREYVSVAEPVVALTNVRVIDGTGAPARNGQTILIERGTVTAVGRTGDVAIPAGARVLSLPGHTVIPGLVGMHNHTFYTTRARSAQINYTAPRLYLASGVTTIRTTGSVSPYSEINMKRAIETGQVPGPRMHITGPYITGGNGSSDMNRLSGPDDARRVVGYWANEGATWFKAYTEISREELGAAIEEAHRHDVKVTGHLCSVSFQEAVALGIDNLEHGFLTNTDYAPNKVPSVCPSGNRNALQDVDPTGPDAQATIRAMVDNGVGMTSTLAVYEMFVPGRAPIMQRDLDAMAPQVREEVMRTYDQTAAQGEDSPWHGLFRKAMEFEFEFVRAGGTLAAGVDPTGYGAALPGYGDQRNYELLLEAGFRPEQVIQIMSANGAKILGLDDRLGTIEAGQLADLVVINGDPTATPGDIRNVTIVFKDGVGYDSAKLIAAVQGQVGVR